MSRPQQYRRQQAAADPQLQGAIAAVPSNPTPSTNPGDVSAGVVGGATRGVQQVADTFNEGGVTGLKEQFDKNLETVKDIKATDFAPGTLGDVVQHPMKYSFAQRMEATKMVQAGQPLTTQTGYEAGQAGCCAMLCVVM
jgi:hypothetical protein